MYKKLLLLLALPVIVLAGDLPMKIDTTRVDTVEVKLVTYDSAIVCPQYGYGCVLGGLMPHSVKAKKWVPTLEYTTDTTYRLTEAEREYVEGMSDTACFEVWESIKPTFPMKLYPPESEGEDTLCHPLDSVTKIMSDTLKFDSIWVKTMFVWPPIEDDDEDCDTIDSPPDSAFEPIKEFWQSIHFPPDSAKSLQPQLDSLTARIDSLIEKFKEHRHGAVPFWRPWIKQPPAK